MIKTHEPRFWRWLVRELERDDFGTEDWVLTVGVLSIVIVLVFVMTR